MTWNYLHIFSHVFFINDLILKDFKLKINRDLKSLNQKRDRWICFNKKTLREVWLNFTGQIESDFREFILVPLPNNLYGGKTGLDLKSLTILVNIQTNFLLSSYVNK